MTASPSKRIRIGNRWIGDGQPCYVIAEAGSNHNGSLNRAFELIDAAVAAHADAVKFQHFKASSLYPASAGQSAYLQRPTSIYEIVRDMETPDSWVPQLAQYCRERDIDFLSTPFDEQAADLLEPHVPAFKIASYEMTHSPLLRHVARKGKPVLLSTGTATLDEVMVALQTILDEGNDRVVLLQCTARYPTPLDDLNVKAQVTIRQRADVLTGLSDHSLDPIVGPMAAVALGACVIEKHITLSRQSQGPDHAFAIEPPELVEMVTRIRQIERALGHGRKEVLAVETELRQFARRTIFSVRDIPAGERLTRDNVAILRAGNLGFGLEPNQFDHVIERTAAKFIPRESLILLGDLE